LVWGLYKRFDAERQQLIQSGTDLGYQMFVSNGSYFVYIAGLYCADLLVLKRKHVLLHQLGVSPPASTVLNDAKQHHLCALLANQLKLTKHFFRSSNTRKIDLICFYRSNLKQLICAGLHQCRKHTEQYNVKEELVLLCAHS